MPLQQEVVLAHICPQILYMRQKALYILYLAFAVPVVSASQAVVALDSSVELLA